MPYTCNLYVSQCDTHFIVTNHYGALRSPVPYWKYQTRFFNTIQQGKSLYFHWLDAHFGHVIYYEQCDVCFSIYLQKYDAHFRTFLWTTTFTDLWRHEIGKFLKRQLDWRHLQRATLQCLQKAEVITFMINRPVYQDTSGNCSHDFKLLSLVPDDLWQPQTDRQTEMLFDYR